MPNDASIPLPTGAAVACASRATSTGTDNDFGSLLWGLGYCHVLDRGQQLLLTRVLGEGRASECLAATPEMLEVDRCFPV
jgi:penicillin G amidase